MAYIKKINGYVIKDEEARTAAANAASAAAAAQAKADETATGLNDLSTSVGKELLKKQNNLAFDGVYDAVTNQVATVKTVTDKIAEVVADAPAAFDTLEEIANYIASDKTGAANMNNAISANATEISGLKSRVSDLETTTDGHTGALDNIRQDLTQMGEAINSNTQGIKNQTITLQYDGTKEELLILKAGVAITPTGA